MKPWVHTDKSELSSVGAALSAHTSEFIRSVVPPLKGLNKYTITNNPGLAPWAMQEYRPYRAHLLMSQKETVQRSQKRNHFTSSLSMGLRINGSTANDIDTDISPDINGPEVIQFVILRTHNNTMTRTQIHPLYLSLTSNSR